MPRKSHLSSNRDSIEHRRKLRLYDESRKF